MLRANPRRRRAAAGALVSPWALKLLDNLRRAGAGAVASLRVAGCWQRWPLLDGVRSPEFGATWLLPIIIAVGKPRHPARKRARALSCDTRLAGMRWVTSSLCWPIGPDGDAIARTLARLFVTRRQLLDWTTAAHTRRASRLDLSSYFVRMRGGVLVAAIAAALVVMLAPENLWLAAPWLLLWFTSPLLVWYLSQPQPESVRPELSEEDATACV